MSDLERRQRRLDRARALIYLELAIAFATAFLAGFVYITAPGCGMCPMFLQPTPLVAELLPWAGAVGLILGIVWMVRLSRSDPEAGERTWRYRDSQRVRHR